jgi:MAF protein
VSFPEKAGELVLASQSPRRRELLALLGLPFKVFTAKLDEVPQVGEAPADLVVRLSRAKAHATRLEYGQDTEDGCGTVLFIACDTIVALDGDLLGKPRDEDEATAMLHRLRGRFHSVHSAVTLVKAATGNTLTDAAETRLRMRAYTDAEIAAYVASGDPLDKAGAYAIQHPGFHPVAELQGCYASVIGLPLCHLARCLRGWGVEPLYDVPTACQLHTDRRCAVYPKILNSQSVTVNDDQ